MQIRHPSADLCRMTVFTMSDDWKLKLLKIILPLIFWLAVWQAAAMGVGFPLLLPTPISVGRTLVRLLQTAAFWQSVVFTLGRVFGGLVLGCILGCALALLTWRFRWADILFAPLIRVIRATPVVSFILLVYLWVVRSRIPGVISAMMVLPVIWSSLRAGLDAADQKLLEMAKVYQFGRWKTVRLIWLPSLQPYLSSGLCTCLGLAWKSGVAAEVICPPRYAIGTELSKAKTGLLTPELYAWTIVIIVLSLLLESVLRRFLSSGMMPARILADRGTQ